VIIMKKLRMNERKIDKLINKKIILIKKNDLGLLTKFELTIILLSLVMKSSAEFNVFEEDARHGFLCFVFILFAKVEL
jgi:hypothetical protein